MVRTSELLTKKSGKESGKEAVVVTGPVTYRLNVSTVNLLDYRVNAPNILKRSLSKYETHFVHHHGATMADHDAM